MDRRKIFRMDRKMSKDLEKLRTKAKFKSPVYDIGIYKTYNQTILNRLLDVEIALQDINKPIGVAEYQLLLPKEELQTLLLDEIKAIEDEAVSEGK